MGRNRVVVQDDGTWLSLPAEEARETIANTIPGCEAEAGYQDRETGQHARWSSQSLRVKSCRKIGTLRPAYAARSGANSSPRISRKRFEAAGLGRFQISRTRGLCVMYTCQLGHAPLITVDPRRRVHRWRNRRKWWWSTSLTGEAVTGSPVLASGMRLMASQQILPVISANSARFSLSRGGIRRWMSMSASSPTGGKNPITR